jgi:c-di-GMP-related signal transduction protein
LSSDLHDAVVEKTGAMGRMLTMVIDYTHSIWSELDEESMAELSLTLTNFSDAYAFAIEQTDQVSALMIEE